MIRKYKKQLQNRELTPKQVAELEGCRVSSVYTWCARNLIDCTQRTSNKKDDVMVYAEQYRKGEINRHDVANLVGVSVDYVSQIFHENKVKIKRGTTAKDIAERYCDEYENRIMTAKQIAEIAGCKVKTVHGYMVDFGCNIKTIKQLLNEISLDELIKRTGLSEQYVLNLLHRNRK